MPTLLTLRLTEPTGSPPFPAHVHAAACGLLEAPDADHTAQHKPFAVGAPVAERGAVTWRLGWLPDAALPAGWPPQQLRLGGSVCRVTQAQQQPQPFAALAASGPVTRVQVRFLTPTYFSRNGRDVPLPDPVLVLRSLTQRWNAFAPAALAIDEGLGRELLGTVVLTDADVHTVRVQVGRDAWQTGFVGDTELALTRTASPTIGAIFAALLRYAAVAGIGARTTYGFGEVSPQLPDDRSQSPHPDADPQPESPAQSQSDAHPYRPRREDPFSPRCSQPHPRSSEPIQEAVRASPGPSQDRPWRGSRNRLLSPQVTGTATRRSVAKSRPIKRA